MADKITNTVYSTLTADQMYTSYKTGGNGDPLRERAVFIKGGTNLAPKKEGMDTPVGVATGVTADQLEFLEAHPEFNTHRDNGFIVVRSGTPKDAAKYVGDMDTADKSAPLVDADFDKKDDKGNPVSPKLNTASVTEQ